ncbi:LysR family transcriptional regulator [Cupriavidus sp. 30B13]|uniref:LysR family transcriptional regulator n=1 Tax=Cupriavidus sp. 30B13 TaxID=3384241 RepID=UPI003B91B6AA
MRPTATPATPDLRLVRSFMAVARHGSVTAAADSLGLTQPALSQHLRAFAQSLGVPLFGRVGRHLELTEAGRQLVLSLEPVLDQLEQVIAAAASPRGAVEGTLRVGAIHTYLSALVMPAAQALLDAHPALDVQVFEFAAGEVDRALLDGQIDLGLAFAREAPKRIALVPLFSETLALIAAAGKLPEAPGGITLAQLATLPLALLPERFAMRRQIDAAAQAGGYSLRPRLEGPSVEALLRAVPGGRLFTIASPLALHIAGARRSAGLAGLAHAPVAHPGFTRTAALHRRRGRPDGAAAMAFIEALDKVIGAAAAGGYITPA